MPAPKCTMHDDDSPFSCIPTGAGFLSSNYRVHFTIACVLEIFSTLFSFDDTAHARGHFQIE